MKTEQNTHTKPKSMDMGFIIYNLNIFIWIYGMRNGMHSKEKDIVFIAVQVVFALTVWPCFFILRFSYALFFHIPSLLLFS